MKFNKIATSLIVLFASLLAKDVFAQGTNATAQETNAADQDLLKTAAKSITVNILLLDLTKQNTYNPFGTGVITKSGGNYYVVTTWHQLKNTEDGELKIALTKPDAVLGVKKYEWNVTVEDRVPRANEQDLRQTLALGPKCDDVYDLALLTINNGDPMEINELTPGAIPAIPANTSSLQKSKINIAGFLLDDSDENSDKDDEDSDENSDKDDEDSDDDKDNDIKFFELIVEGNSSRQQQNLKRLQYRVAEVVDGSTATEGEDYKPIITKTLVTFDPGDDRKEIIIEPIKDDISDPNETITIKIKPRDYYQINPEKPKATMNITDEPAGSPTASSSTLPIVKIEKGEDAKEEGKTNGRFILTLNTKIDNPLTVEYKIDGNAEIGQDYKTIADTVTFNPDPTKEKQVVNIDITPEDDSVAEHDEKIVIKLKKNDNYAIEPDKEEATISLIDNDRIPLKTIAEQLEGTWEINKPDEGGNCMSLRFTPESDNINKGKLSIIYKSPANRNQEVTNCSYMDYNISNFQRTYEIEESDRTEKPNVKVINIIKKSEESFLRTIFEITGDENNPPQQLTIQLLNVKYNLPKDQIDTEITNDKKREFIKK